MKKYMIGYGLGKIMALWICVFGVLVCASSCDSDRVSADGVGKLRLSLSADTTSLSKGINNSTKAAVSDEFEKFLTTADYNIRIVQQSDTVQTYDRFDEMPSEIELKEGAYTLIASKGDNLPSAFENPYFEGSTDFTVKAGMSTPIDVTCTLGNARITVDYTEDFKEAYSDYTVLLSSAFTSGSLEIKKDETRPAYMQVAKEGSELGIAIRLKKITEDKEKTYKIPTPLSIERRQNIRLIFKTDGEALDGIGLEIILDDEMTNVTLNEGIPDFMWKPFEKPTLSPDDFTNGESFTIKVGKFEKSPTVGFAMPAGIASLCVKQWREDKENEEITYDLATDEGVTAALGKNFKWSVNGKANTNVKGERKTGQLFLKDAINSLEAPIEEDQTYTYHYEFSGVDATGKAHATNVLGVTVVVQPAGQPIITFDGFPETTIIEGDDMSKEIEAKFEAEGIIDETKTTLTINDGVDDKVYNILTDGTVLYNDWGISVESGNDATATLKFPKVFSSRLEAPMEGEKTFTYKLDLADKKGRSFPTLTKTLTVKAPVFELTPSANGGDAFACRAFLRAKVSDGTHPDNLKFQWRKVGNGSWNNCKNHTYQTDEICDTLKNLTSGGQQYEIRAIYREKEKRVTEPIVITTENVVELEDGSFENWHKKEVYKNTTWSVGTTGLGIDQWWPYNEGGSSWWTTRNALTTSQRSGVSCYYTSYSGTIPVDNGYEGKAAEISTLGWKEGNTFTELGGKSGTHSAGMLFLGSHSATSNGVETIDYGHEFNVRPNAFEFYYKFKSLNSESFEAYIVVENRENGTVMQLGSGRIMSNQDQASFVPVRVNVHYTNTSLKATHMYIVFRSSTAEDPSVEGVQGSLGALNGYSDSRYVGNVLTIDNVRLIYE
jgi:hypothetical protein